MNERLAQPTMITAIALATEGGLIALALLIASWWGHNPWGTLTWSFEAIEVNMRAAGQGALAALPLFVGLIFFDRFPLGFFRSLKNSVEREVVPLFANATIGEFALISIAAGFGEELFFRGLLQSGLAEELSGPYRLTLAVGIASVVFGVCHWLNSAYALMATVIGVYLGVLLLYTDNLLAPIVAHALYDFLALCYLVAWKGRKRKLPSY
jgi:membrane protease YdiL (CAAX protease family)